MGYNRGRTIVITFQLVIQSKAGKQAPSLLRHLRECGIVKWEDLTKANLNDFRDHVTERVASSSARTYFAVLKAILKRYEDDMDNPETQRRYHSRLRQNMIDYSEMPERQQVFYAFTRNCSSVDSCAKRVGEIFADFCNGVARDDDRITDLANSLRASVIDKM